MRLGVVFPTNVYPKLSYFSFLQTSGYSRLATAVVGKRPQHETHLVWLSCDNKKLEKKIKKTFTGSAAPHLGQQLLIKYQVFVEFSAFPIKLSSTLLMKVGAVVV